MTDDFTEIPENMIQGMCKYLIVGDDTDLGVDCIDRLSEFFSIIEARPDYTWDWPLYTRDYII